jgi:hypothetical protein
LSAVRQQQIESQTACAEIQALIFSAIYAAVERSHYLISVNFFPKWHTRLFKTNWKNCLLIKDKPRIKFK